jgi:hypothetical protein
MLPVYRDNAGPDSVGCPRALALYRSLWNFRYIIWYST